MSHVIYVWGAAKTIHMGQKTFFEITMWPYSTAFPEQFAFYLKVLALLVPEIWPFMSCRVRKS